MKTCRSLLSIFPYKVENKKEKIADFKTAISSTVRSLSNSEKIEVAFGNQSVKSDKNSIKLPDIEEMAYDTDPNNPDTDGDGITDVYELYLWNTDPLDSESFPSENEIYYYENCEDKQ